MKRESENVRERRERISLDLLCVLFFFSYPLLFKEEMLQQDLLLGMVHFWAGGEMGNKDLRELMT